MASVFQNMTFQGGVRGVLDPFGIFGKKKKKSTPAYEFIPYSGARPIAPSFTKESEKALYDTIVPRSQGIGVGYDPARRASAQALLESTINKQKEDDVRYAKGRASAAGLSGNLRAQEALAGRVERDAARSLADQTNALNIEDLTRANEERDINTQRLQNFSNFQFGQGNKVADFDLGVYNAEQGNRFDAAGFNEGVRQYDQTRSDDNFNDLSTLALAGADLYLTSQGAPPGTASSISALAGGRPSGQGIAPTTPGMYDTRLKGSKSYRNLVR